MICENTQPVVNNHHKKPYMLWSNTNPIKPPTLELKSPYPPIPTSVGLTVPGQPIEPFNAPNLKISLPTNIFDRPHHFPFSQV
jgi:hypothetical protein